MKISDRRIKKGIKTTFILNMMDNGMARRDAARLFRKVRKLSWLQKSEARRLNIPMEGAWWEKMDDERLKQQMGGRRTKAAGLKGKGCHTV